MPRPAQCEVDRDLCNVVGPDDSRFQSRRSEKNVVFGAGAVDFPGSHGVVINALVVSPESVIDGRHRLDNRRLRANGQRRFALGRRKLDA